MKRVLLLSALFLFGLGGALSAQAQNVSGTVTDGSTGEPIPGVTVAVKGTSTGTFTNAEGRYTVQASAEDVLVFSFIGYESTEVPVGSSTTLDVAMEVAAEKLSEVIVTANAIERERKELGYSVSSLDGDELVEAQPTNFVDALQGKVAGVNITSSNGMGGSSRITIRGVSSISGANQPLIIVDGVPINNDNVAPDGVDRFTSVDYGNNGQVVNPADIESINVLKGPAAAALYGTRAGNGAIIITTKSGSNVRNKMEVTISSSYRIDEVFRLPDFQTTYGQGAAGKIDSSSRAAFGPRVDGQTYNNYNGNPETFQSYGPFAEEFLETGSTMINSVSLAGSTETGNFRLGYTDTRQSGIAPNTELDRKSLQFSGRQQLNNKFYFGVAGTYTRTNNTGRALQGFNDEDVLVRNIYFIPHTINPDSIADYKNPDGTQRNFLGQSQNPYWTMFENIYTADQNRFYGNFNIGFKPVEWLDISYRLGIDFLQEDRRGLVIPGSIGQFNEGRIWDMDYTLTSFNSDLIVSATKQFGDFGVKVIGGHNAWEETYDEFFNLAQTFADPTLYTPANANQNSPAEEYAQTRIWGVYGDITVDYRDYLFLNVTARNDFNSTLPEDNRSYFFPSASVSFIASEAFDLEGLTGNTVSYLKLRGNVAQVGNGAPGAYLTNFRFFPVNDLFHIFGLDNQAPWGPTNITPFEGTTARPNVSLLPEEKTSFEVGAEMAFFDSRVNLDVTYYRETTNDQIVFLDVPQSTGFSTATVNLGQVRNQGLEILLNARLLQVGDFAWDAMINFARNRNELVETGPNINRVNVPGTRTDPDLFAYVGQSLGTLVGSGWREDSLGNPLVNEATGTYLNDPDKIIGDVLPDFTMGIGSSVTYKGLRAYVLFDWKQGGDIHSVTVPELWASGLVEETAAERDVSYILPGVVLLEEDAEGNVLSTRPNDIPITANGFWGQTNDFDEYGVFDGTYVKLREARLDYSLPKSLLENSPFGSVSFGVEGRNLLLLYSKIPHIDPEVSFYGSLNVQGFEAYNLPSTRSYGFNVRATF